MDSPGKPEGSFVKLCSGLGREADHWVLEQERPKEFSIIQRLEPNEVDEAVRSMRNFKVYFEREIYGTRVKIAQILADEVTIAKYGEEFGEAFRIREINRDQLSRDIEENFLDPLITILPGYREEFHEIFYVEDHAHEYDLTGLMESKDQAFEALERIDKKIQNSGYAERGYGQTVGFLL